MINTQKTQLRNRNIRELEKALGETFQSFFPQKVSPEHVTRETFQSKTFVNAGYYLMPEKYGNWDRALYTVKGNSPAITFVVTGKASSINPYEVGHAVAGGFDLRKNQTVVYQYNGNGKIVETQLRTGEVNEYGGQNGKPKVLLSYIRPTLGEPVQEVEGDSK